MGLDGLLHERILTLPNEVERQAFHEALDAFEDWAACYGLPTTPHVLAAFLVEMRVEYHAALNDLKFMTKAYLQQRDRDVHVPIRAALKYCGGFIGDSQVLAPSNGAK